MNLDNFSNPRWRLNNLYTIIDKNSQRIKFQENYIQKLINDNSTGRDIYLKARQFGITTQEVLKDLDAVLFNRNTTACILAHEDDAISKIFNIAKLAFKYLHPALKPKIDRGGGSKYEMYFPEINSRIYCDLESRGDTINKLHISEAAFADKKRIIATLQAVPINGTVTMETTPNGLENFFHEIWTDDKSPYSKKFYPWFFHQEYKLPFEGLYKPTKEEKVFIEKTKSLFKLDITKEQIAYRRFKQSELKDLFIQEYPEDDVSCFIHSGRNVVDQALFTKLIEEISTPIEIYDEIEIYRKRDVKKNYVMGADVSQGVGGDFSVACVICIEDLEEVAFFRGQLSPFLFAKKLDDIARIFTNPSRVPLLAVEQNNHGHAVLLELRENIRYSNLYFREKPNGEISEDPGWLTNSITRPLMIDKLLELLSTRTVKLNSKESLKEARMLIEEKGKIQAPQGKHDDCVIASAIAVQMLISKIKTIGQYQNIANDIRV